MGMYTYEVMNRNGEISTGKMEADQDMIVVDRLRKMNYTVLDVKEVKTTGKITLFKTSPKVKIGDLALFSRQLAAMLDAGIPVTRALFTLSKQATNPALKKALDEIARNVEGGSNLTDAMSAYPNIFSKLYLGMIHSGEVSGRLEEALLRLSEQLQKDKTLQDNIRSATFYPTVVACFAVLIMLAMMFFLVPIFVGFFPEGSQLPLPTQILINISDSLRNFWYIWLLVIVGLVLGIRYYVKTPSGERWWDQAKIRIPAFGPLLHKAIVARFARTLSTLLAGGIPVVQALQSAGPASGSIRLADTVEKACEQIQEGKNISGPLDESGFFPPMVIHMIAVGEETGSLPNLLSRIAEFYEDEVATMTKGLTALIEPIMLIFVGVIVGGMLIALYLPIFTVVTQMG